MSINLLATFYSFAYILIIVGIAFLLYRYTGIGSEGVRKFIHILVSGWVFILVGMYDSLPWALLGPSVFIVINAVFVYSGFSKYLGMGNRKRDNGLIYYPFSILVLIILLHEGVIDDRVVVASTLMMGFGDGCAALIGSRFGHHGYTSLGGKKSIEGTLTMFIVSITILLLIYPDRPWYVPLSVAFLATVLENLTPLGFDNITVPLLSAVALGVLNGIY